MKTEDIVDTFLTGRIQVVANRDTEKLLAIMTGLSATGTVVDLLPILTAEPEAIGFLQRIVLEANVPNSTLFPMILRNLNSATPASDPSDVLL